MSDRDLYDAVARKTGEDSREIARRGFSLTGSVRGQSHSRPNRPRGGQFHQPAEDTPRTVCSGFFRGTRFSGVSVAASSGGEGGAQS